MWTLTSKTYKRTYHSSCCSISNLFCFGMYILIFALPYFLGSFQKCKLIYTPLPLLKLLDLWRSNTEVVGIPKITYTHKFVLVAAMNNGERKFFSSLNDFNRKQPEKNLLAAVDYTENMEDPDSDNIKGQLNIQFDVF